MSQLQNSSRQQNRPFESFRRPAAESYSLSTPSAAGFGPQGGPVKLTQNHRFFWSEEFFNWLVWLTLFSAAPLCALEPEAPEAEFPGAPWLTGTLIAPGGSAQPYGSIVIEPYVLFTANTGVYNENWSASANVHTIFSNTYEVFAYFGLTPWMDIVVVPQFSINWSNGKKTAGFGDFSTALDFQLYPVTAHNWFPGIKFSVGETFPTGSFQNLDPANFGADSIGAGTFGTFFTLVFYKVYRLPHGHFMSLNVSGSYQVNTSVHVQGYNAYGGGSGTNGRVFPGNIFAAIISFEFTLDKHWALALDNVYTHTDTSPFTGAKGTAPDGAPASVGLPSSEQFSFAPAIEYNFSDQLGLIAGCWFTAAGRNSAQFTSGIAAFLYTY